MNPWAILSLLAASVTTLLANGGGYFRGGVENNGDLMGFQPEETAKIRMVDEKLTIDLGEKEAAVDLRYQMRNETDKPVKVRFGFPVEESRSDDLNEDGSAVDTPLKKDDGKLAYCQDYVITAGGRKVGTEWESEKKPATDEKFRGIAGWFISEISFAPGEEKAVAINFRSTYPLEETSVSEDEHIRAALFKYRLSSAACWAGTIGSGKITLRPAGIVPSELKVLKPVNRFKKSGDEWVWEFKDLEPALADDLEIEARPEEHTYGNGGYTERGGKWSVAHANYAITASSTLPASKKHDYKPENLKEPYAEKAWSEGAPGSGIGEWLELKPEVAKPLVGITLYPGYWKESEDSGTDLFKGNARPKTVLVEINGEYSVTANIPDAMESYKIQLPGYTKPVTTMRLTFKEVYKGNLYEDLCLSGIQLHARLDKKPKIQPAR